MYQKYSTVPEAQGLKEGAEAPAPAQGKGYRRHARDALIAVALLLSASAVAISASGKSVGAKANFRGGGQVTELKHVDPASDPDNCKGKKCWYCPEPYVPTDCIKSSWTGWKKQKDDFQAVCDGNLVRWGKDSGVHDCGIADWPGQSMIQACCDTCVTIYSVVSEWNRIRCFDVDLDYDYEWGVKDVTGTTWSQTSTWSTAVTSEATASGIVEGVKGSIKLSAATQHSVETSSSSSWEHTYGEKTTESYTMKAETCAYNWKTTITDSCGVKVAYSDDFITKDGPDRGNAPCCLVGIELLPDGSCHPNSDGSVTNLCSQDPADYQ